MMASKTEVTITGLDECKRALDDLFPPSVARQVMAAVLTKHGQPIADYARAIAPSRTGQLRRSIVVSDKLSKGSTFKKEQPDDVVVFVGPGPFPKAIFSEFGTSKESPRPYMRPAWDRARATILNDLAADLWTEIAARARSSS